MDILVLKLALTPMLIAAASLAGRRWGPGVSGCLVGLPLTSGPVTFLLALSEGTGFAAATALGPRLTGLLSPYPVFATVLAIFAHHLQGPRSAVSVMRGTLLGLFGFAGFFLVLSALIESAGIAPAFTAAVAVSLALQVSSLWVLWRAPELKPGTRGGL